MNPLPPPPPMKATALVLPVLLVLGQPVAMSSAPPEDLRQNQRARRVAIEFFRAGSLGAAISHLRQNLRPEPAPGGDQTTLPQNLIEIAGEFYNRRELAHAREATLQAHLAAEAVLAGRTTATGQRRAQLYASIGALYESVRFDLATALACYDAALALQPGDPLVRSRRAAILDKQRRRTGGAR